MLVDDQQIAFVKGRQIMDAILVGNKKCVCEIQVQSPRNSMQAWDRENLRSMGLGT